MYLLYFCRRIGQYVCKTIVKIFYYTFADVLVNTSAKPYEFFMVPINSTHQDKPICTLECIVLAIGLARNKTFKDVLANTSAKLY